MSADSAEPPGDSPRAALLAALEVRRYGLFAVAVGAVVAVAVTLFFLVAVAGGRTDEPLWFYPSLAFVVFATSAMLAAVVLVGRRVLRLAVHPAAIVRRSATGGLLAGGLWLVGTLGLVLGPAQPWAAVVDVTLPWAALSTPLGLWAVHTRYKRTARLRPVLAPATLVALLGALLLADLLAFELVALLPAVGDGVTPRLWRLVVAGALALAGGQVLVAALALLGSDAAIGRRVPGLLAGPSGLGLAATLALQPSRLALVCLAAGLGASWVGTCWHLRRVADGEVPTGPDPWPED